MCSDKLDELKMKLNELQIAYVSNMRCGNGVACQRIFAAINKALEEIKQYTNGK